MYRIGAWLVWPYVGLASIVGFLICLLRPFHPDNNRINGWLIARGGKWLIGMLVRVEGIEYLRDSQPRVIIANHQHNEDLFIMGDVLPPRIVVVGKRALAWIPLFGQMFWLGGNVLIDRKKQLQALGIVRKTALAMEADRKSVWIFPEGTRGHGGDLQAFKKGAFQAALLAGVPITMVCISRYTSALGHGKTNPIRVRVLPPIRTAGMGRDELQTLMAQCHQQMRETIAAISY